MKKEPIPAVFPTASEEFKNAAGSIRYQMTNDYMFHAALQQNPRVLKGLICALFRLRAEDICSVQIMNPIKLGEAIEEKNYILDIDILLNDDTLINLEMQVAYFKNWTNRSLSYLCRSFDQLQKGQDYHAVKPVIHIGFLDFTLFQEDPEFYASYKLMNVKNHHVYSDKLELRVVDLTKIGLATDEDKACRLDDWARLFKAATWEEVKMIAKNDTELREASETLYTLNADYLVRKQCEARADYYRMQNSMNREREENAQKIQEMNQMIREMGIHAQKLELKNQSLETKSQSLETKNQSLETKNQSLETKNQSLETKNQSLETKNQSLESENQKLIKDSNEKDLLIAQLKAQLAKEL